MSVYFCVHIDPNVRLRNLSIHIYRLCFLIGPLICFFPFKLYIYIYDFQNFLFLSFVQLQFLFL